MTLGWRSKTGGRCFLRNWTYAYDLFQASGSKVAGQVGIAPLPKGTAGRSASTLGGWQLAISAFSRNKEASWKFIEFMTGRDPPPQTPEQLPRDLPGALAIYAN